MASPTSQRPASQSEDYALALQMLRLTAPYMTRRELSELSDYIGELLSARPDDGPLRRIAL